MLSNRNVFRYCRRLAPSFWRKPLDVVTPVETGVQYIWIPASAGMTITASVGVKAIRVLLALALVLASFPRVSFAADSASLQVTVPAPDPVQAGEVVTFQVLAVNTGTNNWIPGSYYWEAEIYDLEYRFITKTDSVFPQESVSPGGVTSAFIRFPVPDTFLGRRLYRVFLVRNNQRILESDYHPFQVVEHPLQPPPPTVTVEKYKLGGNITESIKDQSLDRWKNATGATNANLVGKVGDSSFLFNTYLLHHDSRIIDPFIILLVYYAPWGTISAGDISPTVSPLSVNGQGMRGAMLEQQKDIFHWMILGGRTATASAGDTVTNGRYQRLLFGVKGDSLFYDSLKLSLDYALAEDDVGSLSADPTSQRFRGPTLTPQKNPVYGTTLTYTPIRTLQFLGDYQKSTFYADSTSGAPGLSDSAWRGEAHWDTPIVKTILWAQRAGTNFHAFGSPNTVADRMTEDATVNIYPWKWWTILNNFDQYKDNLANDPTKVTTTQRILSTNHNFSLPTRSVFNLSYSLNTAVGNPSTAQNNKTTTYGANLTQSFLTNQSVNVGYQDSAFADKNGISHDLDTQTVNFNTSLNFRQRVSTALGSSQSTTKDKEDGSKRKTQTYSASFGIAVIPRRLALQLWGTAANTKNNSTLSPADQKTTTFNAEWTYNFNPQNSLTLGGGYNRTKDAFQSTNNINETTATARYSYSF